jgi:hypothetical protein
MLQQLNNNFNFKNKAYIKNSMGSVRYVHDLIEQAGNAMGVGSSVIENKESNFIANSVNHPAGCSIKQVEKFVQEAQQFKIGKFSQASKGVGSLVAGAYIGYSYWSMKNGNHVPHFNVMQAFYN